MALFKKKSQQPASDPEIYSQEQIDCVEQHIVLNFGAFDNVLHEIVSPDIHVDIAVIPPSEERDFYTLVTVGMGAHKMNVPPELVGRADRAELVFCLPAGWDIQNSDERWYWPLRWMKILARLPISEDSWLGWGHTVPNGGPFADNTALCGMLLLAPGCFGDKAEECVLPSGEIVRFYQLVPLYQEEMDYKVSHDTQALLEVMSTGEFSPVLDITRHNYGEDLPEERPFVISPDKIRPLLKWDRPAGCLATDRILFDGAPVGYLCREEPMPGLPDSGWRFFAGDETDEYLADPQNAGIYDLNTICNYDREIMPYLSAPVGSAFLRDENGAFQPVNGQ